MTTWQMKIESAIGPLWLEATPHALTGVWWRRRSTVPLAEDTGPAAAVFRQAAREIGEYLAGQRRRFDLELAPQGTPFQRAVWDELCQIPYGTTRSYAEIAANVGRPRAVRAVGTANGRNPLCLIIPCHRVITSAGTLGGYAGGTSVKSRLLKLEGVDRSW